MAKPPTDRTSAPLDYESAGVSTDRAEAGLGRLTARIASTWTVPPGRTGAVHLSFGHYANVIEVAGQGIAFSCDGVGSKALIAQMMGKYDTIGIDCIAMNVNDILCVGATPVSLVDYIAVETAAPDFLEAIGIGLANGAREARISIAGGEIAQLPGMIHGASDGVGFDLVGTAIGHVDLDRIRIGRAIKPGDVVIGVASSGVHSNGLTLARKVLFDKAGLAVDQVLDEIGITLGEELLKPTHIYVRESLDIMRLGSGVKALAHITSDGLLNLLRMEATVEYVIDRLPKPPPIFDVIQRLGGISDEEMYRVYNMGIGFCYVVDEQMVDDVLRVLASAGKEASRIGSVKQSAEKGLSIPQKNLRGSGKDFHRV
jgi:phosphoribosylformylglycinamidine cyclo-ligase